MRLKQIPCPVPDGQAYEFGQCRVFVAIEDGLYHLSISHRKRYPKWDEIKAARYKFMPEAIMVAMLLPPSEDYVNLHNNCFHLWEIKDPRPGEVESQLKYTHNEMVALCNTARAQGQAGHAKLKEEVERLRGRDCKATVELCYPTTTNPFQREELKIVDVGVADNCYVVESKVVADLQSQLDTANNRIAEYEKEISDAINHLEHIRECPGLWVTKWRLNARIKALRALEKGGGKGV